MPTPFKVNVPQSDLDAIASKVAAFEWHEAPTGGGWAYGTNLDYMKELCAYWVDGYDWRAWEEKLNAYPQYTHDIDVDGESLPIHFYHVKAEREGAPALLLSHGWPGSVFEFLHIIGPLTQPSAHGGQADEAFDVIIPSLPGYGFSGKPKKPISPRRIARYFTGLMGELGYESYIAQGGDWGSAISGWLAHDDDRCSGAHLNMYGWRLPGVHPESDEEKAFAAEADAKFEMEMAYFRIQMTKPQSLSFAMMDSPVGAAAWIVEKFHGWSDLKDGNIESAYTKDQLLTNVMIYLVTRTFGTATWLYRGLMEDPGGDNLPPPQKIEKPMAAANFPKDLLPFPPRSMIERTMNLVQWTDMPDGGHFAALERPEALVNDVRAFAKKLR